MRLVVYQTYVKSIHSWKSKWGWDGLGSHNGKMGTGVILWEEK